MRLDGRKINLTDQLVEIFGNPDQFTETYQRLLSHRLVENFKQKNEPNIVTDELMRTLEQLRNRLGDDALGQAQVMIKDCQESNKMEEHWTKPIDGVNILGKNKYCRGGNVNPP
jgi:hypothetical protein